MLNYAVSRVPHVASILLVGALFAVQAFAQGRLTEVQVSGSARTTAAVLSASGLKIGQPVTSKDLDAACQRLLDSVFFRGASYRYQSKAGSGGLTYLVNFDLMDETTLVQVVLDIPNTDQDQLWTKFKAAEIGRASCRERV